ncbi:MAG: histidine kinase dimerization/phospho-acceptor domain-containing protein, partial [Gammaproteobacteria bacterium]|nr:histidine kinase dimerization/phospho-acceptor domain-containing protein [Gammaproteobacteria bacterium]
MNEKSARRFGLTIRARLLLLGLAVLSIPYVGLQYLQEMERFLQDSLEQSLEDAARALAGPLHEHPEWFHLAYDNRQPSIFIHDIGHALQIDGYVDDWALYLDWSNNYFRPAETTNSKKPFFSSLVARHEDQVYILLQVNDSNVVYTTPDQAEAINGDYVSLVMSNPSGLLHTYYFAPEAPGKMFPFRLHEYTPDDPYFEFSDATLTRIYLTNIKSEWQETGQGYVLEIRLPEYMLGNRLGFMVTDRESRDRRQGITVGSAGIMTATQPNLLLQQSEAIHSVIRNHGQLQGRRVWVLDQKGQVLAVAGDLKSPVVKTSTNILYEWLLPDADDRFRDDLAGRSRLEGREVQEALAGRGATRWRPTDRQTVIVSAAVPVWNGDVVQGVVMVEETSNRIQLVQRAAMHNLFNKTFMVFMIVTVLLLAFATHLSMRLRKLKHQVDAAIDEHGRIRGTIKPLGGADEIADLSQHYQSILNRLNQYHDYLEGLSGKLSHELRTPMAVVQSSLDNLQAEPMDGEQSGKYLERAQDGIHRLNLLVSRLSEAARIEQAIQSSETETVNMNEFLGACVGAYASAWPQQRFEFNDYAQPLDLRISPDLFSQMLDKLVSNAVDFSDGDSPVVIG